MKTYAIALTLLMITRLVSFSQTATFDNVQRYSIRNSGYLINNGELQGYWTYFMKEKEDKKNYSYEAVFHDNNLKEAASFQIIKPKDSYLFEVVFNNKTFMMTFYKDKAITFEMYDINGKAIGKRVVSDLPNYELARIQQAQENPEMTNITMYPLGDSGFVRNGYTKNDKLGYQLKAVDNQMKDLWTFGSSSTSKQVESATVVSSSEKYVALAVIRKESMMAKAYDSYFILLDAMTGKKILEMPMRDKNKGELSLINLKVDEEKGEILLMGEYYNPGDEVLKDQSMGLYAQRIDMTGKELAMVKYAWAGEIKKLRDASLTDEQKEDQKGKRLLYIHQIVVTPTGEVYALGEEYKKVASAAGIAVNALSRDHSNGMTDLLIQDLVLIQLNNKLEMTGYKLIDKKKNHFPLPPGSAYFSPQMVAAYVKAMNGFDYQFVSADKAKGTYSIIYRDFNLKDEEGQKSDMMIGAVMLKPGKDAEVKRFPINSDATYVGFSPAKPGYIMVTEYFKKQKKVMLHLEKI